MSSSLTDIMQRVKYISILALLLLSACDPLTAPPALTPVVIIITAEPSATPAPSETPAITRTPVPTFTPVTTPTSTPFPCDKDTGEVMKFDKFPSTIAGGENLRYRVYIPPCYVESQARYPLLILLHGAGSKEDQWERIGAVTALDQGFKLGVLPPMVVVMPYWGAIGNDNTFPPDPSYEDVLLQELLPAVERDFCTWNDRAHHALGGISRGGFWAYSIGMRHPDIFGIIGGHSAFFTDDLIVVPPAFNPLEIANDSALLPESGLRMYLDNGAQDPGGKDAEMMSSRLSARAIPHTYVINPVGAHDESYWSSHVSEYLAFYGRNWPRNSSALPSCLEPSP